MTTKYSIEEIDEMRRSVREKLRWEFYFYWDSEAPEHPRSLGDADAERVERELRTYMLNGTTVDELRASATKAQAEFMAEKPPKK